MTELINSLVTPAVSTVAGLLVRNRNEGLQGYAAHQPQPLHFRDHRQTPAKTKKIVENIGLCCNQLIHIETVHFARTI